MVENGKVGHHKSYRKPISSLSVAVVDDAKPIKHIIQQVLQPIGFKAIHFYHDSVTALKEFSKSPPDLVITDWFMPNLGGVDFVQAIRNIKNQNFATVPIIVLTGSPSYSVLCKSALVGVQGFAIKPISTAKMLVTVKAALGNSREFFIDGNCLRLENSDQIINKVIKTTQSDAEYNIPSELKTSDMNEPEADSEVPEEKDDSNDWIEI